MLRYQFTKKLAIFLTSSLLLLLIWDEGAVIWHQHDQLSDGRRPLFSFLTRALSSGRSIRRRFIQRHIDSFTPSSHSRRTLCVDQGGFYKGSWVRTPNVTRPHTHVKLKPHAFTRAELDFRKIYPIEQGWKKYHLPWNEYDFEPHQAACKIPEWNVTRACQILDGALSTSRRILFVGDSMSFTMALSFLLLMGGDGIITDQSAWKEQAICDEGILPKGPIFVHFIRNDALYVDPTNVKSWKEIPELSKTEMAGTDFRVSKPWTPYYDESKPELVILNLGTHIHSTRFFKVLLDEALSFLSQRRAMAVAMGRRPPRILWRTTAPGHPECWKHQEPIMEGKEGASPLYEGVYRDRYTWHLIKDMNTYMETRVKEVLGENDGPTVMRLHDIVKERADGHLQGDLGDCLHYHLPGPPDWWTRVFLEVLRELV